MLRHGGRTTTPRALTSVPSRSLLLLHARTRGLTLQPPGQLVSRIAQLTQELREVRPQRRITRRLDRQTIRVRVHHQRRRLVHETERPRTRLRCRAKAECQVERHPVTPLPLSQARPADEKSGIVAAPCPLHTSEWPCVSASRGLVLRMPAPPIPTPPASTTASQGSQRYCARLPPPPARPRPCRELSLCPLPGSGPRGRRSLRSGGMPLPMPGPASSLPSRRSHARSRPHAALAEDSPPPDVAEVLPERPSPEPADGALKPVARKT